MKKILLIAGGGTLGLYTAKELLGLGHAVDIICLDDMTSDNEKLRFFKANATVEYLKELFKENRYDGIVNFIHYNNYEDYIPYHELLSRNTDHLIFLSSYRVYADLEHPITENAPQLIDVIKDHQAFIEGDNYGLSKSKAEIYLKNNDCPKNWTVVRPVISFSDKRLDIILTSANRVVEAARTGEVLKLPIEAKNLTAGLDWAGNSGKLIANLLFKKECIGEAYTISSAQNLKWCEVTDIYTELLGVKFEWAPADFPEHFWHWKYDRAYDRAVDNSKVLAATGLKAEDFTSIRGGIIIELKKLGALDENNERTF